MSSANKMMTRRISSIFKSYDGLSFKSSRSSKHRENKKGRETRLA
jgi:hypothetical protein